MGGLARVGMNSRVEEVGFDPLSHSGMIPDVAVRIDGPLKF